MNAAIARPRQLSLKKYKYDTDIVHLSKAQEEAFLGFFISFSQLDHKDKESIKELVHSYVPYVPGLKENEIKKQFKMIDLQKTSPGGIIQWTKRNVMTIGVIALATSAFYTSRTFYKECEKQFEKGKSHAFDPVFRANQTINRRNASQARYAREATLLGLNQQLPSYKSAVNKTAQLKIIQGKFTVKKIPLIGSVIDDYLGLPEPEIPKLSRQQNTTMATVQHLKQSMKQFQIQRNVTTMAQLEKQYVKARDYYKNTALPELEKKFQTCITGEFLQSSRFYNVVGHSLMIIGMLMLVNDSFSQIFVDTHTLHMKWMAQAFVSVVYGYKMDILGNSSILFRAFVMSCIEWCFKNKRDFTFGALALVLILYIVDRIRARMIEHKFLTHYLKQKNLPIPPQYRLPYAPLQKQKVQG